MKREKGTKWKWKRKRYKDRNGDRDEDDLNEGCRGLVCLKALNMTWRKQLGANVAGKVEEKGFEAETSMKINGNVEVVSKNRAK